MCAGRVGTGPCRSLAPSPPPPHLTRRSARSQRDMARGWNAWAEAEAARRRHRRLLQSAANRLRRPKIAVSYAQLREGWEAESRAAEIARLVVSAAAGRSAQLEALGLLV